MPRPGLSGPGGGSEPRSARSLGRAGLGGLRAAGKGRLRPLNPLGSGALLEVGRKAHRRQTDPSVAEPRKATKPTRGSRDPGDRRRELPSTTGDRGEGRARMCWFTSAFGTWVVRRGTAGERGSLWGLRTLEVLRDAGACGPFGRRAYGGPVASRWLDLRPATERQPSRAGSTGAPLGAAAGSRPGHGDSREHGGSANRMLRTTSVRVEAAPARVATENCG